MIYILFDQNIYKGPNFEFEIGFGVRHAAAGFSANMLLGSIESS